MLSNWKALAGLALGVFVGLNYAFHFVTVDQLHVILGMAAAAGIFWHGGVDAALADPGVAAQSVPMPPVK